MMHLLPERGHWSHKGNRNCDPWWENETDWHRSWKGKFPVDWQEAIHFDDSGEKHIADVKTKTGWVLEFQHSYLSPEERRSRNTFYPKLVWVVDGARRKTDKPQFQKLIKESTVIWKKPIILKVNYPNEYRLLREWHNSNSLVFLDFQESKNTRPQTLWFLYPKVSSNVAYISPFPRVAFTKLHNESKFDEIVRNVISPILKTLIRNMKIKQRNEIYSKPNRLIGFERYLENKRRRRRRF